METDQLSCLKQWFTAYTQSFLTGMSEKDSPLVLKIEHTARVCDNICRLSRSLLLADDEIRIAEAIGLLHDVGRFHQYRRYKTFNDLKSANHAVLGIRVIGEKALLEDLSASEKELIIDAIRYHNAPVLPREPSGNSFLFRKLIRDADKLDIWKVFADYYRGQQAPEAAVVQYLADGPECETSIIKSIMGHRIARFQNMKTINDFRLLQLSWVFDLNFPASFAIALQRGDLETISHALPDAPEVNRAVSCVMDHLDRNGGTG
jgi:hypothetical protein